LKCGRKTKTRSGTPSAYKKRLTYSFCRWFRISFAVICVHYLLAIHPDTAASLPCVAAGLPFCQPRRKRQGCTAKPGQRPTVVADQEEAVSRQVTLVFLIIFKTCVERNSLSY